jgi:hypothetical protein
MKLYSTLVSTLFAISAHSATLPVFLQKKADSSVNALGGAAATLKAATDTDVATIVSSFDLLHCAPSNQALANLVSTFPSDVTAQAAVVVNLNVALADIASQINTAAHSVVVATTNALAGLNPVDLAALVVVLTQIQNILANVQSSVKNEIATMPASMLTSHLFLSQTSTVIPRQQSQAAPLQDR